jgi:replicative DNA helicase
VTDAVTTVDASKYPRPVNIAAERATLAGLCQFGHEVLVDVNEIVQVDCFTTHVNQVFYKSIVEVLNKSKTVDIPSIISTCTVLGFGEVLKDKQNNDYVRSLFGFNISKENCVKNSKIIRKLDIIRKAQAKAKEVYIDLSALTGAESIGEILSKIEQPIFDYTMGISSGDEDKTELIGDGIDEYIDFLASERPDITGIPSPWPIYNEAIGGGRRRGGVYLIAARPKVGKSSFAINDAIHVATLGIPVLYLDTEMNKKAQLPRILGCLATQSMKSIEHGDFATNDFYYSQIKRAANELKAIPLHYRRIAGKPFDEILSIIRRWIVKDVGKENGATKNCLIIYDYFKLMDTTTLEKMSEHQALGFQIQSLADMCNEYDVACSAFVQMNRDGITKDTTEVISQSDRLVWLCSSLALLKRKTIEEVMTAGPENGNMKLIVTQEQRFGPGLDDGDWVNFIFDKDKCQVRELSTKNTSRNGNNNPSGDFNAVDLGVDDNAQDGFTDDDFDEPGKAFRDDSQRRD